MKRSSQSLDFREYETALPAQENVVAFAPATRVSVDEPALDVPAAVSACKPMHAGVIAIAIAGWACMLLALWLTFGSNLESGFAVAISTFYAAMYFGVPAVVTVIKRNAERQHSPRSNDAPSDSFGSFLNGMTDTCTGPVSGVNALVQVAYLPLALAAGTIAMGVILMLARSGQL